MSYSWSRVGTGQDVKDLNVWPEDGWAGHKKQGWRKMSGWIWACGRTSKTQDREHLLPLCEGIGIREGERYLIVTDCELTHTGWGEVRAWGFQAGWVWVTDACLTHRVVGSCSGTCSYCCWLLATRRWPGGPAEALTGWWLWWWTGWWQRVEEAGEEEEVGVGGRGCAEEGTCSALGWWGSRAGERGRRGTNIPLPQPPARQRCSHWGGRTHVTIRLVSTSSPLTSLHLDAQPETQWTISLPALANAK